MSRRLVNYYIDDEGTLYVYIDNALMMTISDCQDNTQEEVIDLISEELFDKGYYWLEDGTAIGKPECELILKGENGNIYNLMGIASRTLKITNPELETYAQEMQKKITETAQNYNEALAIIGEYVNII